MCTRECHMCVGLTGGVLSDTLILADRIAGRRFDNSLIYYSDPLA